MMENPTHAYSETGDFEVFHTPTIGGQVQSRVSAGTVTVWPRLSDYLVHAGASYTTENKGEALGGTPAWTDPIDLEALISPEESLQLFPAVEDYNAPGRSDLAFSALFTCNKKIGSRNNISLGGSYETLKIRNYRGPSSSIQIKWETAAWGDDPATYRAVQGYRRVSAILNDTYTKVISQQDYNETKLKADFPEYPDYAACTAATNAEGWANGIGWGKYFASGYWNYTSMLGWDVSADDLNAILFEIRHSWTRNETTGKLTRTGLAAWINGEYWMDLPGGYGLGGLKIGEYPENPDNPGYCYTALFASFISACTAGEDSSIEITFPSFYYYGNPITRLWYPSS